MHHCTATPDQLSDSHFRSLWTHYRLVRANQFKRTDGTGRIEPIIARRCGRQPVNGLVVVFRRLRHVTGQSPLAFLFLAAFVPPTRSDFIIVGSYVVPTIKDFVQLELFTQSFQNPLNRSAANSVYRTGCWIFRCPM